MQIFDYAQYYLNLGATNRAAAAARAKTKEGGSASSSSSSQPALDPAQWRLEYNFTTHYRLLRRRTGHFGSGGRGIVTAAALDRLAHKLTNNRFGKRHPQVKQ